MTLPFKGWLPQTFQGTCLIWHWGWGGLKPVITCWEHWELWLNEPSNFTVMTYRTHLRCTHNMCHWGQGVNYPVGKGWVFFKNTHQSTHWVTLWKNPLGSLRISFKKCPSCAWATQCGFFQKVSINLTTMYPAIYLMGSLRVCGKIEPNWGFSLITLK